MQKYQLCSEHMACSSNPRTTQINRENSSDLDCSQNFTSFGYFPTYLLIFVHSWCGDPQSLCTAQSKFSLFALTYFHSGHTRRVEVQKALEHQHQGPGFWASSPAETLLSFNCHCCSCLKERWAPNTLPLPIWIFQPSYAFVLCELLFNKWHLNIVVLSNFQISVSFSLAFPPYLSR